ncbi:type VI secretion system tip protein VgrG [Stieleria sp. TO1_6]|uniref:type VI secretion system Vgr family protein n=1 Tax=Stieleria tagensis TaxID=2956795 RepID=UPI00209AE293|nr:type VI secretion system tip protein VgrG [Stieleria tagensis]MCO8121539.1 type VI secretion system tip protein VgrG [Stieleria tagensis]
MNSVQQNRGIQVVTPLGTDKLLLYRMEAVEELGRPFHFDLELLSTDSNIDLDAVLGQSITVKIDHLAGGSRFFNGMVNRISWVGDHESDRQHFSKYRASVVPWLWFLTRTADCRIFQEKLVPDIITELFGDHGFSGFDKQLSNSYREWEYCVQYRESAFNFVSRLMEQEGIYYYFKHSDGEHRLQMVDSSAAHSPTDNYATIPYYPPDPNAQRNRDHIYDWSMAREVQTGTYVLNDFDFQKPRAALLSNAADPQSHEHAKFEVFDYPGEYTELADGDNYVKYRIQEQQAGFERVNGKSNALGIACGSLFTLDGYPRSDQNAEYLLVSTKLTVHNSEYESGGSGSGVKLENHFTAISSDKPFRAARQTPLPMIRGPQTAVVVGKSGEEIWTDKFGRVKVQFHWDRLGEFDENSSCWVRVAQSWAGKSWGTIHIPRIGQEVIVEHLEGDPDRPIITGRVYNADEMPPYKLPDNATQSGIKTQSTTKATNQNFNELRFEDKKGEEHVYFHAEKDFNRVVENNDTLKVGFEKKDAGDQTIEIFNNQNVIIGNGRCDDGSQTVTIWKDFNQTLMEGDATIAIEKGSRITTIENDEDLRLKSGSRTSTIEGDDALTLKSGDRTISIDAGKQSTEAAKSISLKVGGNSITIDQKGITIKGMKVSIQGDTKVSVKAPMTEVKASGILTLKGGLTKIN